MTEPELLLKVTDTRTGAVYRLACPSKTKARRWLTRFDDKAGEYRSFWKLEEIPFHKFRQLPPVPWHLLK